MTGDWGSLRTAAEFTKLRRDLVEWIDESKKKRWQRKIVCGLKELDV